jgi:hypothetical protein
MSPCFVGLRRPQAGSAVSYTNDSPADRHGFGAKSAKHGAARWRSRRRGRVGHPPGDNNPFDLSVFYGGIFQATWSFQLALRSRGLGSTLHHLPPAARVGRGEDPAYPDDVTQTSLIPVAFTTVTEFKPAPRIPASEVAYADHWGTPLH